MKNKQKPLIYIFVLIGVLQVVISGCKKDDDNTNDPVYPVSSMSFDYSGYLNGHYDAIGEIPLTPDLGTSITDYEWADALHFQESGVEWTGIMANLPTGNGRECTALQMHIKNPGTGNFALPGRGDFDFLCFGMNGTGNQQNFLFQSGTIKVTTFKSNRIIGSFNGKLQLAGDTLVISNGVFNMHVTID